MYAVIEAGGKQFRVAPGDTIQVDTLSGEPGSQVELGLVVAVMGDDQQLMTGDRLSSAKVTATIAEHGPRRQGHRLQVQAQEAVQAHHRPSPELHGADQSNEIVGVEQE